MSGLIKWIEFAQLGDERGQLCVIEAGETVPFPMDRVYYIYGTLEGVVRGFHAHRELNQVLIAVSGVCKVKVDDGSNVEHVTLDCRTKGLCMPPMLWHEMYDFSNDCVLLCIASAHYDESDYIRDYETFLELSKG